MEDQQTWDGRISATMGMFGWWMLAKLIQLVNISRVTLNLHTQVGDNVVTSEMPIAIWEQRHGTCVGPRHLVSGLLTEPYLPFLPYL